MAEAQEDLAAQPLLVPKSPGFRGFSLPQFLTERFLLPDASLTEPSKGGEKLGLSDLRRLE